MSNPLASPASSIQVRKSTTIVTTQIRKQYEVVMLMKKIAEGQKGSSPEGPTPDGVVSDSHFKWATGN